ncbi:MAG: YdcF family protein [Lactobacillus sp.]|nr:YdcF family protein [Lactobacillus sp.]
MFYVIVDSYLIISLVLLGVSLKYYRQTILSGIAASNGALALLIRLGILLVNVADRFPTSHFWLIVLFALAVMAIVGAIYGTIILLIYNGIVLIKREGFGIGNLLALFFGLFLLFEPWLFSFVWDSNNAELAFRVFLFALTYWALFILLMYLFTSLLNLVHFRKHTFKYIVVLGAWVNGDQVTPLLKARIDRGIALYKEQTNAKLIMTGGRGSDEQVAEGVAMAKYAISQGVPEDDVIIEDQARNTDENLRFSVELMDEDHGEFAVVTNSYHVYRALVLARKQGLKCLGYGAKSKLYFTINAFLREYIAYLTISWKMQLCGVAGCLFIAIAYYFGEQMNKL